MSWREEAEQDAEFLRELDSITQVIEEERWKKEQEAEQEDAEFLRELDSIAQVIEEERWKKEQEVWRTARQVIHSTRMRR
jgi:hypothetical protein